MLHTVKAASHRRTKSYKYYSSALRRQAAIRLLSRLMSDSVRLGRSTASGLLLWTSGIPIMKRGSLFPSASSSNAATFLLHILLQAQGSIREKLHDNCLSVSSCFPSTAISGPIHSLQAAWFSSSLWPLETVLCIMHVLQLFW